MSGGLVQLSDEQVRLYLDRINCEGLIDLSAANLERLHFHHIQNIVFENFDIHIGRLIEMDVLQTFEKIVERGRGGFCYELNPLFGSLLHTLGYDVTVHACLVINSREQWIPFGHICLNVACEGDWLIDVGFGNSFQRPLEIGRGKAQVDEGGTHLLEPVDEGWLLRSRIDTDELKPEYRFDRTPRHLNEFKARCKWTQTSTESGFTHRTFATKPVDGGRLSVLGLEVRTYGPDGYTERKISPSERDRIFIDDFGLPAEDIALLPKGERAPWIELPEKEGVT